jgi:alanyl-tRNA synthetase
MNSRELREKFLDFFEKHGHTIVPSSSLLPADPSVLFTTAGMQQFKEYYLGNPSPYGKRVASCQKCFRTSDIDEVGDAKHLTFLEMLGNFSFGDYFKKETIGWALEFLVENLKIPIKRLSFTYFGGENGILEDQESLKILEDLKIPREKIFPAGRKDNFWGPTGKEGPCGPTVEIHYDLTGNSCQKEKNCIPNCECGRFVELWNLVFNEYYQDTEDKITPLGQKGVDTGMGLERLTLVSQKKESIFETDLFSPIIFEIEKMIGIKEISSFERLYTPSIAFEKEFEKIKYQRAFRIIADHIRASVFLSSEGILPSNIERGYVLRRILRRAIRFGKLLILPDNFLIPLAKKVIEIYSGKADISSKARYKDVYPEITTKSTDILTVFQNEEENFRRTLERGLKQFEKISARGEISGIDAFHLFDTYGFPLELVQELAIERGLSVDIKGFKEAFDKHREISRAGMEKKFGGVGREVTSETTKLHTATHLLQAALRKVLGGHIKQMGSDITPQRLRFDFSHPNKMSVEEIKKVEDLVNQKIKEDLEVKKEEMLYEKAIKSGALAFFREKYPKIVSVYSIGDPSDPSGRVFSKEICAGPHIKRTSELGHFKIIKEESSGAGIRRIRAILDSNPPTALPPSAGP